MQIHELPAGSPASGLQFAGDTGTQTQKIDYDALADAILNKLTTKTFNIKSESQTIIAALNALGDASKQDVANDLVTTAAGLVLDARQGKALDDKITSLNSSLPTLAEVLVTCTASPWAGKYYQDVNVSSYIPSGKRILGVMLGSATDGGVYSAWRESATTIRLMNPTDFTGAKQTVILLIGK